MIHFKNHKGFTFIEIMVAIMLLAIFGTSLFMVQTSLFTKIFKTHRAISNVLALDKELVNFKLKLHQAFEQKKSIDDIKLQTITNNQTIELAVLPIANNSSLYKLFSKQVRWVQATVINEGIKDLWPSLIYIPPVAN